MHRTAPRRTLAAHREGLFVPELLYLDYNCFQRGFDDARQARIRMEAAACEEIFAKAEDGSVELVWSFMHEDENEFCPFVDRKVEILRLSAICRVRVGPDEAVQASAMGLAASGLGAKDAVHLAAASFAGAAAFITCDDEIVRKTKALSLEIEVINPVQYALRRG